MSAQGVVVLRAKKRENGSMPSLAISCLTDPKYQSSLLYGGHYFGNYLPRDAVNVMTTMFPNIENAMIPDITR